MARLNDGIYYDRTLCTHSTRRCEGARFKFPSALLARLPEPHKANGRQTLSTILSFGGLFLDGA